ncbi:DUF5990 family protein [Catenuloplanes atrovinosus]|uniref:Monooxygenase n=1 Tax=Catenuloplanes atrovinosus TaxID=137266 RepID=A0AAE3YPI8_9ACTN|nr:DUF5990 family protein [Catenuloplanes atrovinosus]MDR7276196.1 hypothetical protein [Catenuloplanes atrovinosus]
MRLRIEGTGLPGRVADTNPAGPPYRDVHVGVQRRADVIELIPGDAASAVWDLDLVTKPLPDGSGLDFGGPFVHGRRGARFVYLCWVSGGAHPFRRAKLHPADAGEALIADAATGHGVLVARLGLTDAKGGPICATVRPPVVTWTLDRS